MKYFLLALSFVTLAHANDIPNFATVGHSYQRVEITEFKSAKLKAQFYPESQQGVAAYKGTLEITMKVQGNICENDPTTLGSFDTKTQRGIEIELLIGHALKPSTTVSFCRMYARDSEITYTRAIYFNKFNYPGSPALSETYLLEIPQLINGSRQKMVKALRVYEDRGELVLEE